MKNSKFWLTVLALILALSLAACAEDADEDGDGDTDGDDSADGDTDGDGETATPEMPVARCGMDSYTLVPKSEVGKIVEFSTKSGKTVRMEEDPVFKLTPAAVDSLLEGSYKFTALSPVPYGCRVYRFRYSTQDKGKKIEATAVLGIPTSADLSTKDRPFILALHGTTGFSAPCAPSHGSDGPATAALLSSLGFITVHPDYIGMNGFGEPEETVHGYLVGEQVAIGAWDAMRAAKELIENDLKDKVSGSDQVMLWGGSQGGHSVLFSELYAPYYAPEFKVPGVVALVPPTDLMALAKEALSKVCPPSGSFVAVLTTMQIWYGKQAPLSEVFTDTEPYHIAQNVPDYVLPKEECKLGGPIDLGALTSLDQVYNSDFIDAMEKEWTDALNPWAAYLIENTLATTSVPVLRHTPTLMVYSEKDDLVVTAPMLEDFDRLCGMGYKLDFLECADAGHTEGAIWSLPEQLAWMKDRLAGKAQDEASLCKRAEPVCCTGRPDKACTR